MNVDTFKGTWDCLVSNIEVKKVKIEDDLVLLIGNDRLTKLRPDDFSGALVAEDLSVSYWNRKEDDSDSLLLYGMKIEKGRGEEPRSLLWAGELALGSLVDLSGPSIKVQILPEDYLHGLWRVGSEVGKTGGREGDLVMLVASRKPGKDGFSKSTKLYLCYQHHPRSHASSHTAGPWIQYDTMLFNSATGSLESIHGHRSLSFMRTRRPPGRYLYAMFHRDVPQERLMPFEQTIRQVSMTGAGEGDGGGAWGAEGG